MRKSKDQYFMDMLELVASRATCPRRRVGAIITGDGIVLSTGYNGTIRGAPHCIDNPCPGNLDPAGDTRKCEAVHAEQNALLQCARLDLADTIYVTTSPCFVCAKMILQVSSIMRIIAGSAYKDEQALQIMAKYRRLYFYNHETGTADIY